jgi:hypothetical protein
VTALHPEASRQAVVEAALVLLERMGVPAGNIMVVDDNNLTVISPPAATYT